MDDNSGSFKGANLSLPFLGGTPEDLEKQRLSAIENEKKSRAEFDAACDFDEEDIRVLTVTFEQLKLGMFLVSNTWTLTSPPCGFIVTGIREDGFNARDDRAHNVWFFPKEEMGNFYLFTSNKEPPEFVRKEVNFDALSVNYSLIHDVMHDNNEHVESSAQISEVDFKKVLEGYFSEEDITRQVEKSSPLFDKLKD